MRRPEEEYTPKEKRQRKSDIGPRLFGGPQSRRRSGHQLDWETLQVRQGGVHISLWAGLGGIPAERTDSGCLAERTDRGPRSSTLMSQRGGEIKTSAKSFDSGERLQRKERKKTSEAEDKKDQAAKETVACFSKPRARDEGVLVCS